MTDHQPTRRSRMKADRRRQLLAASASLFAERGFRAVSIEDLGGAVGISGPAVYRYFPSKEAVLAELLVGVSHRLLEGGQAQVAAAVSPLDALERLVVFHTAFALQDRDLIRLQDRDFANLPPAEARTVRRLQRAYVEVWVEVLVQLDAGTPATTARTKAHATFGLLNSTPHSAANRDAEETARTLEAMAIHALTGSAMPRKVAVAR